MKNHFLTYTAIAGISYIVTANAEEPIFYQDANVEIANRSTSALTETGATVNVVEETTIQTQQSQSAAEVLATIPGAYVSTNGGMGQQTNVSLRGLSSGYTKVLYNGVDVADPTSPQPFYNFAYMPSFQLSRIEVAQGNQSTLYGSEAIAGVINIQSFSDTETLGAFGTFGIMGGSYDTINPYFKGGYNGERAGISLYGDYFHTSGISASDENEGNDEADGFKSGTFGFNSWLDINDYHRLEVGAEYTRAIGEYDGYDPFTYQFGDADNNTSTRQYIGYTRLKGQELFDGKFNYSLDLTAARTFRDYDAQGYAGYDHSWYDGRKYGASLKGDYQLTDWFNFAMGGDYSYSEAQFLTPYDSKAFDHNLYEAALWSLATFTPTDNLNITLGGRWQDNEIFGDKFTWRATGSYLVNATGTRFHGSAGSGFRAPSLYELYAPYYGNLELEAEDSLSYDFGIEQRLWNERILFDITGFYTEIDNKIDYNTAIYQYINAGEQRSYGVEASLSAKPFDWLEIGSSYAYVKSYNPQTDMEAYNQPRHRLTSSITWTPNEKFNIGADIRAYSDQLSYGGERLGGFATIDLRAAYAISDDMVLKANIQNLLDKDYEVVDGYSSQGFGAYVGLEASF